MIEVGNRSGSWLSVCGLGVIALVMACGDDASVEPVDATSTTTSASASASTSGPGGSGGAGGASTSTGAGGSGGAGGGLACIDEAAFAAHFTLEASDLCVVAIYDAPELTLDYSVAPTWGRHAGPLTLRPAADGAVDLVRWTPPDGPMGALVSSVVTVEAGVPADTFLGAQAIDLPFFGWTALSYTTAAYPFPGEVILVQGAAVERRYAVNGFFAGAGISGGGNQGRLVHSGLSAIGDPGGEVNGLYASDSCGTPGQDPRLVPDGDADCAAPILVAAGGDFSGPVAIDHAGNAFAVLPGFSGTQEILGFAGATVGRGAGPTAGDSLLTLPGSGLSLATIAPARGAAGVVAFQPSDPATFAALDVVGLAYTVTGAEIAAQAPMTLLTLATDGTTLAMMTDELDRIWVGAPVAGGGTTYVVIARRP